MKIRKDLIPGLIIGAAVIVGGSIFFQYDKNRKDRILGQLNIEFPMISIKESLEGVITQLDQGDPKLFRNNPHHAYIILDDSIKRRINASYELTKKLSLDEVLKVGDKLMKAPDTNQFRVYKIQNKDTLQYTFDLTDDLGFKATELSN